jgi:hypothetical protein
MNMDTSKSTHLYRSALRRRLLGLVSVSLVAPVIGMASACGTTVTGGQGGQGGHGGASTTKVSVQVGGSSYRKPIGEATVCVKVAAATSSGTGGAGAAGGMGGAAGGMASEFCPPLSDPRAVLDLIYSVTGFTGCAPDLLEGPTYDPNTGECCYLIMEYNCGSGSGRPYTVEGEAIHAQVNASEGWATRQVSAPAVDDLSAEAREVIGAAWTRDALMEHASIASFGRFALELMAIGAPASLVAAAHAAALDEVKHAAQCFALASAYVGQALGPDAFDFGGQVTVSNDIAGIARATFEEGCVNETWASVLASEQLAQASEPSVRQVLKTIAQDEASHAELAWRSLRWMLSVGGEPVRAAIEDAVIQIERRLAQPPVKTPDPVLTLRLDMAAHGRLSPSAEQACYRATVSEVVLPCARALLEGDAAHAKQSRQGAATIAI